MVDLVEISRVVVIADVVLEETFLPKFKELGAKGYNVSPVSGKGRHETLEDPYTGRSLLRIEVLCKPDVAHAIVDYVHRKQFGNYPVAAFIDTVQVAATDKFF